MVEMAAALAARVEVVEAVELEVVAAAARAVVGP